MVPRTPTFSATVSRSSGVLCAKFAGLSISQKKRSCNFIVRAEAETAVEVETILEPEVTGEKPQRQARVKLGDVMGILNKKAIEESGNQRATPDLRVGDVVEIKLEVPENRRRLSIYKGIVMSKQNVGIHTTIRIRRIIAGVGVEIVFPVYSLAITFLEETNKCLELVGRPFLQKNLAETASLVAELKKIASVDSSQSGNISQTNK